MMTLVLLYALHLHACCLAWMLRWQRVCNSLDLLAVLAAYVSTPIKAEVQMWGVCPHVMPAFKAVF
jgi:hypothetical protein